MFNDLILLLVNQIGSGHDLKERLDCSQNFECIRSYLVNGLVAGALKTILSYHAAVLPLKHFMPLVLSRPVLVW